MGLLAYAPLGGGLLAGDEDGAVRRREEPIRSLAAVHASRLADHARLCRECGASPAVVALA
jgi:aryl-alcohol dehydrogenase-like predicted oxidoreductase